MVTYDECDEKQFDIKNLLLSQMFYNYFVLSINI
jgi:hypothetical protein